MARSGVRRDAGFHSNGQSSRKPLGHDRIPTGLVDFGRLSLCNARRSSFLVRRASLRLLRGGTNSTRGPRLPRSNSRPCMKRGAGCMRRGSLAVPIRKFVFLMLATAPRMNSSPVMFLKDSREGAFTISSRIPPISVWSVAPLLLLTMPFGYLCSGYDVGEPREFLVADCTLAISRSGLQIRADSSHSTNPRLLEYLGQKPCVYGLTAPKTLAEVNL